MTWQLRTQLKNLLQRKPTTAIQRPGPVRPRSSRRVSFVGRYGSQSFSIEISEVEGKLYRDDNELYPIDGERYCSPASGFIMRFRRSVSGEVDAIVPVYGSGRRCCRGFRRTADDRRRVREFREVGNRPTIPVGGPGVPLLLAAAGYGYDELEKLVAVTNQWFVSC